MDHQVTPNRPYALAIALAAATLLLCWPAFWNGYPFYFFDTGAYLVSGLDLLEHHWISPSWARPPFYGLISLPVHFTYSLWPIIFLQALVMSHLLFLTMRVSLGHVHLAYFVAVIAVLSFGTSLPWHADTLTPDIFTPVVVLGFYLLAFGRSRLGLLEQSYVFLLTAAAITTHFSHLALAGFMLGITALLLLFSPFRQAMHLRALVLSAVVLALALTALVSINKISRGEATVSTHGNVFLLARYKGLVHQYLEEVCPGAGYEACNHMEDFGPGGSVLWGQNSFLEKLGPNQARKEAKQLLRAAVTRYPFSFATSVLQGTLRQLIRFRTGDWINRLEDPAGRPSNHAQFLENKFPVDFPAYASSRQNNEGFPFAAIASSHIAVISVAAPAFLLVFFVAYRNRHIRTLGLYLFVIVGVVGNALFTSAASGVVDRYNSRLIWLIVFIVLVGTSALFRDVNSVKSAVRRD
jgi:hypothetical protein